MHNVTKLIDRYIAAWNETDVKRRRDLIAKNKRKTDPKCASVAWAAFFEIFAGDFATEPHGAAA